MSETEKIRQEAMQMIEDRSREMEKAMRAEMPELAAAFGAMAATAGIAFLLRLHKPSEPYTFAVDGPGTVIVSATGVRFESSEKVDVRATQPSAEPTDCRSPYCECEVGKCTHGRIDKRGQPVPTSTSATSAEPVESGASITTATEDLPPYNRGYSDALDDMRDYGAAWACNKSAEMKPHASDAKKLDSMLTALYCALPFLEVAETDPLYKTGAATRLVKQVRAAINLAEGK